MSTPILSNSQDSLDPYQYRFVGINKINKRHDKQRVIRSISPNKCNYFIERNFNFLLRKYQEIRKGHSVKGHSATSTEGNFLK